MITTNKALLEAVNTALINLFALSGRKLPSHPGHEDFKVAENALKVACFNAGINSSLPPKDIQNLVDQALKQSNDPKGKY
jgi:hypothetical protein